MLRLHYRIVYHMYGGLGIHFDGLAVHEVVGTRLGGLMIGMEQLKARAGHVDTGAFALHGIELEVLILQVYHALSLFAIIILSSAGITVGLVDERILSRVSRNDIQTELLRGNQFLI